MYRALRFWIWVFLIVGGILAVLVCLALAQPGNTVFLVGMCVCCFWAAYGFFIYWRFGLKRLVAGHLGKNVDQLTLVNKEVGASRAKDYVQTFEHICESTSGKRVGINRYQAMAQLKAGNLAVEQIDWHTLEGMDGTLINVPTNSVYLLAYEGKPFVVRLLSANRDPLFEHEETWSTGKGEKLELCAQSLGHANAIIKWLADQISQHSIYRGQMLKVASPEDGALGQTIQATDRPFASRDEIILPEPVFGLLDKMISRHKHRKQLAVFSHKSRLGLLLHGAPGTGKTLVTRYLIGGCPEHTVIVPADMAVETLRESFRLARYLQPSMLVIEDVDLLATARTSASRVDGLQELMNEMDGLNTDCDCIILMSTNRPEVLEPALASRPGRVSQAIEFPLPDTVGRQRLIRRFLAAVNPTASLIDQWVQRTEGASPAFLEELCRRGLVLASERTNDDDSLTFDIQHDDLQSAMHELVVMGGSLTQKVLGFPDDASRA